MEKITDSKNSAERKRDPFFRPKNDFITSFFKPKSKAGIKSTEQTDVFEEEVKSVATFSSLGGKNKATEDGEDLTGDTKQMESKGSLSLSDNTYDDSSGTASHKVIKFNAKVPGGESVEKYALVNWVKGHMKKKDGTFWKGKMYDNVVDVNYADYQVDSVDKDPVYWSDSAARWNFSKVGTDGFSATDDPGPALSSEKGADYDLNFKIGLYKLSDLPATTTGTVGSAKEIDIKSWSYKVKVGEDGKFTH